MRARTTRSRGFTLIETMVVIGILGLMAALTIPMFYRLAQQNNLRHSAAKMVAHLRKARGLASSGRDSATSTFWGPTDRTRYAGIDVISTTQYRIFIDRDRNADGDEIPIQIVNFATEYPDSQLQILNPAPGTSIRFRSNGTVINPLNITIRDQRLNQQRVVVLTGGGRARLQ